MQVFKTFMKILKSKIPSSCVYIIIFIAIGTMMAMNTTDNGGFEETKVSLSIIDEDKTEASKSLIKYLGQDNEIVDIENDKDVILNALYYEDVSYVLTIKEGYSQKIQNGETDNLFTNYKVDGKYSTKLVDSKIDEYISTLSSYTVAGNTVEQAVEKCEKTFEKETKVTKESFEVTGTEFYSMNVYNYFLYLPYIVLSVVITSLCPVLLVMNKKEIRNRTNCSCVSSTKQTTQLILGVSTYVLAIWVILTAVMMILYRPKITEPFLLGLLNSFIFLVISSGIALVVSQLVKRENVISMIANVIGLGMSFLCGIFVPQEFLGEGVLNVARFLPVYWNVKANVLLAGTSGETYSVSKCLEYLGVEAIFAVALFAIVLLIARLKRKSA